MQGYFDKILIISCIFVSFYVVFIVPFTQNICHYKFVFYVVYFFIIVTCVIHEQFIQAKKKQKQI